MELKTTGRGWVAGRAGQVARLLGATLVLALLALSGCRRDPGGQLPQAGGEKLQGTRAPVEGFDLVRAWPDQSEGSLALALEFSRPLVGTQDFDALLKVEPAGSGDSGWSPSSTSSSGSGSWLSMLA